MKSDESRLSATRDGSSDLENHYIDELVLGRLSRRDFLQRGALIGMSVTAMGSVLAACGAANKTGGGGASTGSGISTGAAMAPTKGGTLTLAIQTPATAMNPLVISDAGGCCLLAQTGEFLTFSNNVKLQLQPMLATAWKPNHDGSIWTFKLRAGVRFHDGGEMTAKDVVYSLRAMCDPKLASNALSSLGGVLKPTGVVAVDSHTVAFHLEAPNGNFPYLVSSDNYNAVVVPSGTDFEKWGKTFVGTGPFVLDTYTQGQSAKFRANRHYWGGAPHLDVATFTFFESQSPQITALQDGQVDVVTQFVAQGAQGILANPARYPLVKLRSSQHRELSMRCDQAPFDDPRVREAVGLSLDRPAMVSALLKGLGEVGNDSPFAPMFKSTNTNVPQRTQNIAKAKQLLKEAGHPHGVSATLYTEQYQEIPALAQVIAQQARAAGINIKLDVETQSSYYGSATFGKSDWLDGTMSLVDYGQRAVPNVFLGSPLLSSGPWNAAHFKNPTYDKLMAQYVAAVDLATQRAVAGKIETLLLKQTPIVIPYFLDGLTASTPKVRGLNPTALAQIFLKDASISA